MTNLNVAIIGCGRMGRQRGLAVKELGGQVKYCLDADHGIASSLISELNHGQAITDVKMIDWNRIDAIILTTPPAIRDEYIELAIIKQKHIFIEKPLGLSATASKNNLMQINKSKIFCAVGYMNRYRQSIQHLKELLSHKTILGFNGVWVNKAYSVAWWKDKKLSGGALNEQCTHLLDLLRYLLGEIIEVQAFQMTNQAIALHENVSINLKFANSLVGNVIYSCLADDKTIGLNIYTKDSTLSLHSWNLDLKINNQLIIEHDNTDKNSIFVNEIKKFMTAIQVGNPSYILSNYSDAYKSQCVVDAIKHSLDSDGKPVLVNSLV